jgi:hypothetical protein
MRLCSPVPESSLAPDRIFAALFSCASRSSCRFQSVQGIADMSKVFLIVLALYTPVTIHQKRNSLVPSFAGLYHGGYTFTLTDPLFAYW